MTANQMGLVKRNQVTRKPYFVGFNTVGQPTPPYSLTDIELIKRDINNHFATPMGSRVMLPGFGSNIPKYLFDPFDQQTKDAIIEDAVRVIQSEPRVELVSINVYQQDQTLTIAMVLLFKPSAITDNMFVTFTQANQESF